LLAFFCLNTSKMKKSNKLLLGGLALIALLVSNKSTTTTTTNTNPSVTGGTSTGGTGTGGTGTGGTGPGGTGTGGTGTGSPTTGTGTTVTSFNGIPSTVIVETVAEIFSPEKFAEVVYPTFFEPNLGFNIPHWIVTLHTDLSKVFKTKNIDMRKRGYFGSVDWREHNEEGTEWNYFIDPNTGQPFANNFNTRKSVNMNTFSSALPIEKRLQGATMQLDGWDSASESQIANWGNAVARSTEFGDYNVQGKAKIGLVNVDWENNYENGINPRKAIRFIKSACENLQGIFQAMYLHPLNSELGYLTDKGYPDQNGAYNQDHINPIFKVTENMDGINYKAIDSLNLAPLLELAHCGETTFEGFFDGVRNCTAYGSNANIEHYLARVVNMAERNYAFWKSLGRDLIFIQDKLICDRSIANAGWQYLDGNRKGGGAKTDLTQYLTRDMAFKSTLATFFSGCHKHEWNRPVANLNADCYNGLQFAMNLLGEKKTLSNGNFSAVDLRTRNATFDLWNTGYKFTGETNYRREKGFQLKDHKDNLLVRTMRLGSKVAICVLNPYNVATKFDLTVTTAGGGYVIEKSFTAADWKSCYPNETRKDYIFDIVEMDTL
jgi:hypothetical protein